MNIFLVLCLFITSTLASGGGGGWGGHRSIRAPAFVLPVPEIGFTFDKLPLFLPIPKIVLRKNPAIIAKPVVLPSFGHGFGHGFASFSLGGHGGGHGGGGGGGYEESYEGGY